MNKLYTKILVLALLAGVLIPANLQADEGMWMVQFLEGIYPNMKKAGLKLKPGEIYNQEGGDAIADAIVSLDFGCTGSMISRNGLMITNHHCAYGDIHSLSTPDNNYLSPQYELPLFRFISLHRLSYLCFKSIASWFLSSLK